MSVAAAQTPPAASVPPVHLAPVTATVRGAGAWFELTASGGRVIAAALVTGWLVVLFFELPLVANPLGSVSATALNVAAVLVLVRAPRLPLGRVATAVVVFAAVGSSVLTMLQPGVRDLAGYDSRHVWQSMLLVSLLVFRGRIAWAWLTALAVVGLQPAAQFGAGARFATEFSAWWAAALPSAGILLLSTVFVLSLRRTSGRIATLERRRSALATEALAERIEADERAEHVASVTRLAGPLLRKIARGLPLTADERLECHLLESQLRDAARSPLLAIEPLTGAVRSARSRGLSVSLLDDLGEFDPGGSRQQAADWAAGELASLTALTAGTATVRLLPPGRRMVATLVIADAETTTMRVLPSLRGAAGE